MKLFNKKWFKREKKYTLDEATDLFKQTVKSKNNNGEGIEDFGLSNVKLKEGLSSFNLFYNNYINTSFHNEISKIINYRLMSNCAEISDVIEDAVIESTQENESGDVISLIFKDTELKKNENKLKTLKEEFSDLFDNRIKIKKHIWNMLYSYYIDGRVYYERIGKKNVGITNIKKLPAETMDFQFDSNGNINFFVQYLNNKTKLPPTFNDAIKDKDVITFYPNQISYITSGHFGNHQKEIFSFLEKCKQPYNQLKLLETAVIIYRIIRAPERLVFKIDTGNLPRDKAMKYVEKLKTKYQQTETYDPESGNIINKPAITCIRKNTGIQLLDGRILSLEEIIKEFTDGKENWVYSINQDTLKIEPDKIVNAQITRKNEKLIRVWVDNDIFIDTTYDHKFILKNGTECRADELNINQSLMSLYRKKEKIGNLYYDKILQPNDLKWKYNHKVIKIEYLNEVDDTGCITTEKNHNFAVKCGVFIRNSLLENFWMPQSADGRGSSVESIGGNFGAFGELQDIWYFQRKLYRSLKYPMSRVIKMQEGNANDVLFGGSRIGEITRDEIKWAKFLERQQNRICEDLKDIFLLHLEFKGIKKEYELNRNSFDIEMTPPNQYKEEMEQMLLETKQNNYSNLANNPEFPKTWLMNKYLDFDENEFKEMSEYWDKDEKYLKQSKEDSY